jgi:hypothetical protein
MSKTLTKKLDVKRINAHHIQKAFELMGLNIQLDSNFRLYGRTGRANIVIPSDVVEALGLKKLAFSNGIGVNIQPDGSVEMVFDHYNLKQAEFIEKILAGLEMIGANPAAIENKLAEGYAVELRPEAQRIGIALVEPENKSSNPWGTGLQQDGGVW